MGTSNINRASHIMYNGDVWLESIVAIAVADCLAQFLRAYLKLAQLYVVACEPRFALLPKLHMVHEIEFELRRQGRLSRWVLSPIVETCSMDEDFVGRCAVLTRKVSPQQCALRSIQRYLAQINIFWMWAERNGSWEEIWRKRALETGRGLGFPAVF